MVEAARSFGFEFKTRKGAFVKMMVTPLQQPRAKQQLREFEVFSS